MEPGAHPAGGDAQDLDGVVERRRGRRQPDDGDHAFGRKELLCLGYGLLHVHVVDVRDKYDGVERLVGTKVLERGADEAGVFAARPGPRFCDALVKGVDAHDAVAVAREHERKLAAPAPDVEHTAAAAGLTQDPRVVGSVVVPVGGRHLVLRPVALARSSLPAFYGRGVVAVRADAPCRPFTR